MVLTPERLIRSNAGGRQDVSPTSIASRISSPLLWMITLCASDTSPKLQVAKQWQGSREQEQ